MSRSSTTGTKIPLPIKNISCQELLIYSDIVLHGFLRRRPALNKFVENISKSVPLLKWPNSYVILRDGCLYVFKHEKSQAVVKASSLYGFTQVCRCEASEVSSTVSWAFKVASDLDYRNNIFYFSAVTEKELQKWMSAIQQQIDFVNNSCNRLDTRLPYTDGMSWPSTDKQTGHCSDQSKQVATKFAPVPVRNPDLDYEIETESDSDYEDIVEEVKAGNVTDDFKDKQKKISGEISQQLDALRTKPPSPGPKSGVTSPGFKKPPDPGPATRQFPPKTGPKPVKSLSQDATLQQKGSYDNMSKQPLTGTKSLDNNNLQPGYYAVQTLLQADESPQYVASESYPAFTGPSPTTVAKTEPLVQEAYWRGPKLEGEKLMKTLSNGVYMIRESSAAGQETMMIRGDSQVQKYHIITTKDGQYSLDPKGPWFSNRTSMIFYYRSNCLPGRSLKLTKPYTSYSPAK